MLKHDLQQHIQSRSWKPRPLWVAGVLMGGLLNTNLWAESVADKNATNWVDQAQSLSHQSFEYVVKSIDGWFGDEPFERSGKVNGQIRVGGLWREDDGLNAQVKFRGSAQLPNLRKRAYVFFGMDNKDEALADKSSIFSRQKLQRKDDAGDDAFFAGIGFLPKKYIEFRVGLRNLYKPFTHVRFKKDVQLSPNDMLFLRETLFWSLDYHFGTTTAFEYVHYISPTLKFRWANSGTWAERKTKGLSWNTNAGFVKYLTGIKTNVEFGFTADGETDKKQDVDEYALSTTWTRFIYREKLNAYLSTGYHWPYKEGRHKRIGVWSIGSGLELYF